MELNPTPLGRKKSMLRMVKGKGSEAISTHVGRSMLWVVGEGWVWSYFHTCWFERASLNKLMVVKKVEGGWGGGGLVCEGECWQLQWGELIISACECVNV